MCLSGRQLKKLGRKSHSGFVSTLSLSALGKNFEIGLQNILAQLKPGEIPILSSEAWMHQRLPENMHNVFERLDIDVEIFAVVRPPVEYINSSWWQWGVWSKPGICQYTEWQAPATMWHQYLSYWEQVPGVSRLDVIDIRDAPLESFKKFLGASDNWNEAFNLGSSAALIDFLLSQPGHLGRTPNFPEIEFCLNRYVNQPPCTKPFLMGSKLLEIAINATKDSVYQNQRFFSNPAWREAHITDPAYTSIEYYQGRELRRMGNIASSQEQYDIRVALAKYFTSNPRPDWLPASYDISKLVKEVEAGVREFGTDLKT